MKHRSDTFGQSLTKTAPAAIGWLFFLIGPCFLGAVYWQCFQPVRLPVGWRFFKPGQEDGLLLAGVITCVAFSGAGVSILAQRKKLLARAFDLTLREAHPDSPWKWQADWVNRRIRPEMSYGQGLCLLWAGLCLLAAWPCLEIWSDAGWGTPNSKESIAGASAVAVACLTVWLATKSLARRFKQSAVLHLASDTGVIGGPLQGAIECNAITSDEVLVRLICERHWISVTKTSDGTRTEHKIDTAYEDTHRSSLNGGFFPIRFAVPFGKPETSREQVAPVYYWYVELEDTDGRKPSRFQVPVFQTEDSREGYELPATRMDESIDEERPEEVLHRCGISVSTADEFGDAVRVMDVRPMRAPALTFGLLIFGLVFLGVSFGIWSSGTTAVRYLFVIVFGVFGLLITMLALPLLLERRRVEFDGTGVRVRRSFFGFGWTRTLTWDAVNSIDLRFSGSVGGRVKYQNVVARTEGMTRRDGSKMDRRWSIISTVPAEAARAAKSLLEAAATS